jgi:type I restriction enzyme, R subunit
VRERNYFGKDGADACAVPEALQDRYADCGITEIGGPDVLELIPFSRLGSKTGIRRRVLGGSDESTEASPSRGINRIDRVYTRSARSES